MKDNYTLKNDVLFKLMFGQKGREKYLKDFLEGILKRKIPEVNMGIGTVITPEEMSKKGGIMDVRANFDDGTKIDIEMQNENEYNLEERAMFYFCKMYSEELKVGRDYKELPNVVVIFILNFNYFKDISYCHSKWIAIDDKYESKPMRMMEMHFIELPKFRKAKFDKKDKLMQWLALIDYEDKERLDMAKEENSMVCEANAEYDAIFEEEKEKYIADCVLKAQLARNTVIRYAEERGEKKGRKEGVIEGRKEGVLEGEKRGKKMIIRNLIKSGAEISFIAKITELTEDEVKSLI